MKKVLLISLIFMGFIALSPLKMAAQTTGTSLPARNAVAGIENSIGRQAIKSPAYFPHQKNFKANSEENNEDISQSTSSVGISGQMVKGNPTPKDVLLDEGFETWIPAGWNFYELGVASVGWQQSGYQPHTGSYSAFHGYFSGGVHDNWMVTPQLTIDQTYTLNFWDKLTSYNYYEYSGVFISIGSGDPSAGDFIEIYNADNATANVWQEHEFDLSAFEGEDIYIAFQYSGNNAHRWYVDDVSVIPLSYLDGGLTAINNPPVGTTTVGGSIENVTVTLKNFGTEIIEDAEIEWMVNNIAQTSFTISNLALEPAESVAIIVGQYDFSQYFVYNLSFTCTIVGDQNVSNDTKTGTYTVDDLGDAGIIDILPNGSAGAGIIQDVSVKIKNYGTNILESVEIEWQVDGVAQTPFIASNLGLASGGSTQRTIGQFDFSNPDYYTILAGTNIPIDYVPANDTMSVNFASGMLWESFEGPHFSRIWPPDHWEMKYGNYMQDWPLVGDYMGHIVSGGSEWGSSDGWFSTPLLDINPGDNIKFYMRTDAMSGGGFSINWQDGQTGEVYFIESVSVPNWGQWYVKNIDISAAAGINRIVFKVSSSTYAEVFLDSVTCTAPTYTYEYDIDVLRFQHDWTPFTNMADTIKCKVRNYTTSGINAGSYTVNLMEEPDIVLQSISGYALNPLEIIEYEFYHTFTDEEQHNLFVQVDYASDQNPADNISNIESIYPVPPPTQSIEIGENDLGNLNIPFDTFGTEGLGQDDFTQIIYHFDEVGSMGYIYGLKFHYNLYGLMYGQTLPLKVWIGETLNDDLSGGWEPYENMTLVFDSLVITKNYLFEMFIPFDEPYLYTGGNIVIQTIQYDPEFMASWTSFHCTETPGELRTAKSPDWYEIDPENPPSFEWQTQYWEQLPDATFIINPFENISDISGTITDDNNLPLENVLVEIVGTAIKTFTDAQGVYLIPTIPYGNWTIQASYLGYENNVQIITVDEENETLNFSMTPKPLVSLSGYVEGSGAPGEPLEDANIDISGYNGYDGLTSSSGVFNIVDVFGNADYSLKISKFGFEPYTTTFSLTDENTDFGTIILTERTISAYNVTAEETIDDAIAEIYWPDPLTGMEDTLQYDMGDESYGLANDPLENVWLGNFMPNNNVITITSVTVFFINNPQTPGQVTLDIFDEDENLLVSSEPFLTQNDSYITVDFPNLTYDGNLYIMLHWKDNPATTDFLGIDFTPNIADLCYIHYPGQGFELLSNFLGTDPGVALIRANYLKQADDKKDPENKSVLSYNIYRGESDDFYNISNWTQINSGPVSSLEYIDESWLLTEPNNYRYAVEALYASGNSEVTYTNILSIDFIAPTNPYVFVVSNATGTVEFTWDSPEHNVQSYMVYLDDMTAPVAVGIAETEYTFEGVSPGFHTAGVKAVYNSGPSEIVTVDFDILTNIGEAGSDDVSVYPNPANNYFIISNAKGYEVNVLDLAGKRMMHFVIEDINHRVDISALDSGIFLIQLSNEKNTIFRKLDIVK